MDNDKIAALISRVRTGVNRFLLSELKKNGIEGLAPSHGAIFFHLFANESVTMKELAKAVRRDKSTVTALVGKLAAKGYVEKQNSSEDKRTVYVRLTRKGRAFKQVFEQISGALNERIWQGIDQGQQKEVIKILKKMESNFR